MAGQEEEHRVFTETRVCLANARKAQNRWTEMADLESKQMRGAHGWRTRKVALGSRCPDRLANDGSVLMGLSGLQGWDVVLPGQDVCRSDV